MSRHPTLSLLASGIISLLASCDPCDGSNQIIDQEAMEITALMDSIDLNSGLNSSIELKGISKTRDGGRKCRNKDLVISYGEKIKSTDIHLSCDKPLVYGPGAQNVIQPGTNMLDYTDRIDLRYNYLYASTDNVSSGSIIINADPAKGFKPGVYTFTITGKTSLEHTFTDTTAITFYQSP
jgi:hypothetical protein